MASSPPSFCNYRSISCKINDDKLLVMYPRIRSQSFRDEGKSMSIVDANLNVLKERMEQVKKRERLQISSSSPSVSCCKTNYKDCYGWNYQSGYVPKHNKMSMGEAIGSASGALAFAFLSGSLCIYLVSLLAHFTPSS